MFVPTAFIVQMDKNKKDVVQSTEIEVNVYTDFSQIQNLRCEWDAFVEVNGGDIFMTFDWCRVWWKYYGKNRDLRIYVFRNNNKLVGIIPLFLEKLWLGPIFVRAVKIVGSDFTLSQFCLPLAVGFIKAVVEKLSELLSKEKWDIMCIGPIAGLYDHYDTLRQAVDSTFGCLHSISDEEKGVQTYFQLAENWEDQLSRLSAKERNNIRRNYRNIYKEFQSESVIVESKFVPAKKFETAFNKFVELHQLHWTKRRKAGHFGDWPESRDFHFEVSKAQLKKRRLRLLKVSVNDICLGYEYDYKFGDKYFAILNAFSDIERLKRISMFKIVFTEHIRKAIQERTYCIDSMRGFYKHKIDMGGEVFPIRSIYIIHKKCSVLARVYLFKAFSRFLDVCYYKIWFRRIAPKLPFKRRPLWKLWIRTRL